MNGRIAELCKILAISIRFAIFLLIVFSLMIRKISDAIIAETAILIIISDADIGMSNAMKGIRI